MKNPQKIVVIEGPTASGKTGLAVELAKELGGEIINADSMQVYRGMDIGTAKPTKEERKNIPHHMIDVVDPDEEFNAAIYRSLAIPIAEDILKRGKVCFLVGGTGLYIKTFLGGLFNGPSVDHDLRKKLREKAKIHGPGRLHEDLRLLDPEAAKKIHPNDLVRLVRAHEVIKLSKTRFSDLSADHGFKDRPFHALSLCLDLERERLYERIDKRSVAMVEGGLAEETKRLLRRGYSPEIKSMQAIGYRHMVKYLMREWHMDETVRLLQRDTRRYAKRQLTWFRSDSDANWIDPGNYSRFVEKIKAFINETT